MQASISQDLFNIIGNDPVKLAQLNDEIVMNKSKGMDYSKYGGMYDEGGFKKEIFSLLYHFNDVGIKK